MDLNGVSIQAQFTRNGLAGPPANKGLQNLPLRSGWIDQLLLRFQSLRIARRWFPLSANLTAPSMVSASYRLAAGAQGRKADTRERARARHCKALWGQSG